MKDLKNTASSEKCKNNTTGRTQKVPYKPIKNTHTNGPLKRKHAHFRACIKYINIDADKDKKQEEDWELRRQNMPPPPPSKTATS